MLKLSGTSSHLYNLFYISNLYLYYIKKVKNFTFSFVFKILNNAHFTLIVIFPTFHVILANNRLCIIIAIATMEDRRSQEVLESNRNQRKKYGEKFK